MSKVDKSNSWDHVRQLRELLEGATKHEGLGRLQASWQLLVDNKMTPGRLEESERLSFSPATYMAQLVRNGCYPPPEYLVWLGLVIDEYVEGKGNRDLEVLLFGERTSGRQGGIYAARERAVKDRFDLIMKLGFIRKKNPGISLRHAMEMAFDIADEAIGQEIDIDVKLKTLRDHGYTHELFKHIDHDRWYFEVNEDKR